MKLVAPSPAYVGWPVRVSYCYYALTVVTNSFHCHLLSRQYCIWTDGLNALLGKDMMSDLTRNDLDTLLSMEIKLRLLDLENIQIPDAPPPIPKEPSNYDFVYDCN